MPQNPSKINSFNYNFALIENCGPGGYYVVFHELYNLEFYYPEF